MDDVFGVIAPHPPIMVPAVGGEDAAATKASADALGIAASALDRFAPETLVLMSPHAPGAADAFAIDASARLSGDLGQFGAPHVGIQAPGDPELARAIAEDAARAGLGVVLREADPRLRAGWLDHASIVPLTFLDPRGMRPLVIVSLSWQSLAAHRSLGRAIRDAAQRVGRRVAFIASGDCSHRLKPGAPAGYDPRGAEFDERLRSLIATGDFHALETLDPSLIDAAGECGLRSFITLGGFTEQAGAISRVLAYEGPWGVGYLTALVGDAATVSADTTPATGRKGGMPGTEESPPVALARRAIEAYVREHRVIDPDPTEGLLAEQAGTFVSLHRGHELRGCIGTIAPTRPTLADEIVHNAIQAATSDPRFPPLSPAELADLEISVDVLHTPEACSFDDLDPATYGVIVSCDWRRGLLLPDLEGVETAEQQCAIAMRKAGIDPAEKVTLERFKVDRYH
ncbi:MAG: AmmeMemoRadiSam system protein A [Coriobacteriia bacterium]